MLYACVQISMRMVAFMWGFVCPLCTCAWRKKPYITFLGLGIPKATKPCFRTVMYCCSRQGEDKWVRSTIHRSITEIMIRNRREIRPMVRGLVRKHWRLLQLSRAPGDVYTALLQQSILAYHGTHEGPSSVKNRLDWIVCCCVEHRTKSLKPATTYDAVTSEEEFGQGPQLLNFKGLKVNGQWSH